MMAYLKESICAEEGILELFDFGVDLIDVDRLRIIPCLQGFIVPCVPKVICVPWGGSCVEVIRRSCSGCRNKCCRMLIFLGLINRFCSQICDALGVLGTWQVWNVLGESLWGLL